MISQLRHMFLYYVLSVVIQNSVTLEGKYQANSSEDDSDGIIVFEYEFKEIQDFYRNRSLELSNRNIFEAFNCAKVVEDSAFYRPTQNGNGDRIVEDPGFYRPTQNGNSHIVEDSAFYRPTYGGNQHGPIDPGFYRPGNQNNYEPISNGPAFVEDGRKHYDNPNLRSGK